MSYWWIYYWLYIVMNTEEELKSMIRKGENICGKSVAVMFPKLAEEIYNEQKAKTI